MGRRLVPRKGLGNVARDPLSRRMVGHAQQDQTASFMPQDHQDKQQPKVDCRDYKEVHGPDPRRMVTQERLPCLARSGSTLGHVLGNRRLSDLDPELQQFAMNTRRAPERALHAQPPDQAAQLNRNSGPAAARTRLPSPIKPKARPMPAQHSVRLDDRDGAPQRRKQPPQPDKKQPVSGRQPGLRGSLSTKHVQLMPQQRDLGFQLRLRPEGRGQNVEEQPKEVEHRALPYLTPPANPAGMEFSVTTTVDSLLSHASGQSIKLE